MKSKHKKILLVVLIAVVCTGTTIGFFYDDWFNNPDDHTHTPPPYEHVQLSRFPISLDALFLTDLPTNRTDRLDQLAAGMTQGCNPFIDPYPNYFTRGHAPATFKWYINPMRHLPISFPIDTYFKWCSPHEFTTITINGSTIMRNIGAEFQISYYIYVGFDHVCLNQSLYTAFNNAGSLDVFGKSMKAVLIPANTIIGFSEETGGPDFLMVDSYYTHPNMLQDQSWHCHGQNPLFYFTPGVQTDILDHYEAQHETMKLSGAYVEGSLNRTYDINEAGTIFGTWFYKQGWFALNASHHVQDAWYGFDASTIELIDVNKTDHETFYKDVFKGSNFGSNMTGVFYDARYVSVEGYVPIGGKYMYFVEGNNATGIIKLENFVNNIRLGTIYCKYQLNEFGDTNPLNDMLSIEYFTTLPGAQGDFTPNELRYTRTYGDHV